MTTDYEPPSRRVSRELLGGWALKDLMAHRALQAGITEAELIHSLLQDRQCLMERLHESISRTPPPIILAQPAPEGPTVMEIIALADEIEEKELGQVDLVRRALARWGRLSIEPVPVSERLPKPEDCDAEGRCWIGSSPTDEADNFNSSWELSPFTHGDTHWLPHYALPVPAPSSEENYD